MRPRMNTDKHGCGLYGEAFGVRPACRRFRMGRVAAVVKSGSKLPHSKRFARFHIRVYPCSSVVNSYAGDV